MRGYIIGFSLSLLGMLYGRILAEVEFGEGVRVGDVEIRVIFMIFGLWWVDGILRESL